MYWTDAISHEAVIVPSDDCLVYEINYDDDGLIILMIWNFYHSDKTYLASLSSFLTSSSASYSFCSSDMDAMGSG